MMRKPFVAGNWKMNTDVHSSVNLAQGVVSGCKDVVGKVDVAVCPPFVYLQQVAKAASGRRISRLARRMFTSSRKARSPAR